MPVRGICEADAGAECATDLLGYTCNLKLLSLGSAPKIGYNDARTIAEHFAAFDPSRCTSKSSRSGRAGKVFIDYLRNGRGNTAIGPYSPRARPGFPVAAPVTWRDLEHGIRSDAFSMHNPPGFCAIAGAANAESASAPIRVNDLLTRDLCLLCTKYSMHRAHAVKSKRRNSCQEAVDRDDRARPRQPVRLPAASQQRAKRQPASRWPASQWLARPRAAKRQRARLQAVRRQRARPRPGRPPPEHQQFASQQRAEKQQLARRRPA